MQEVFVKKSWDEENVLFYMHFQNGQAVRQIEETAKRKVFLTVENPNNGESMLYDQTLDELDLQESDFITEEEFNNAWNDK